MRSRRYWGQSRHAATVAFKRKKWIRPAITSRAQRVMARAGDAPSLEARLRQTQSEVRRVFLALLQNAS
jgi:hypothetical protein